jgi:preprotein translocase subunit SecA
VAYKREAHDMWDQLLVNIRNQITRSIYHVELAAQPQPVAPPVTIATQPGVADDGNGAAPASLMEDDRAQRAVTAAAGVKAPPRNLRTNQPVDGGGGGRTVVAAQKVGRNEPCPCGCGKKYQKCHGGE